MIYEVEGDIMLSRAQVIALGVSTFDPMTRGLARKLHERFPVMVEAYNSWCAEQLAEPGQLWLWGEPNQQQVLCLITHEGDDDPTRAGRPDKIAVHRCFRALNRLVVEQRLPSIAMPTIGAGEFGLDWAEVRGMMHSQLGELLIPLFVYTKELDGQVAHEPGL
jgi:O-acetyl-ADP-ribose deacetylase (regulator of RNase III)